MKNKSVADVAYEILSKQKKPLHFRKITTELMKIRPLNVKEPYYAVNASMSGDKRFMRSKRGVWGLVKWKYKDANIKYSLTSYCLKDGTMFLTSYIRPFFPQDKNMIEVTFIDKEGNEIEATVNNEINCIVGLKEWYEKKELKVNDIIFVGLIDYDRKRYFLVTEDETQLEPKEELGEKIYQILQDAGHPLTYKEICEKTLEIEVKKDNLFSTYINNVLTKDPRFVVNNEEIWGLFDWLSNFKKLRIKLINSEDNESFKIILQKVFNFLGFKTSVILEGKASFILVEALLDYQSYNLIVDGKVLEETNKKIQKYEYWSELNKAKEKTKSEYSVLISPNFEYNILKEKIDENKVILFELRWLDSIIKEHDRLPFSLTNLKTIFLSSDSIENNIFQLFEKRKHFFSKIKLINIIITILTENSDKKNYLDLESLTKIIIQKSQEYLKFGITQYLGIEEITQMLSLEPFNILQKTEMGNIILDFKPELAKERLHKVIEEIFL